MSIRSILQFFIVSILVFTSGAEFVFSQGADSNPVDPKRGAVQGASFSISDIENINLTNGNLMMNLPLVSLPGGRKGLSASLRLTYNSKLYDSSVEELPDLNNQLSSQNMLVDSPSAGWRTVSSLNYQIRVVSRIANGDNFACVPGADLQKKSYIWKVQLVGPDGNEKELRPLGYDDIFSDGFFDISPSGYQQWTNISSTGNGDYSCSTGTTLVHPSPMVYMTTDGSFIRYSAGVIYFPDGSKLENGRLTDRNGNWVENTSFTYNGAAATGIVDQFGRKIFRTAGSQFNETYYYQSGFGGVDLKWTVRTKEIFVRKSYLTTGASGMRLRGGTSNQQVVMTFTVIDEIDLPSQLGGQKYQFGYNGSDTEPAYNETTTGWGELSSVTLPTGAISQYEYKWDGTPVLTPKTTDVLANSVKIKTLTYDETYDGQTTSQSDVWHYTIGNTGSSVTSPDGSIVTQLHGSTATLNMFNGLVYSIENPNGTKVEKVWDFNRPLGTGALEAINPFVKAEYTSIKDSSGNYSLTAIKEFSQDKNGNTTQIKEYDFVPYGSVPRDAYGNITGLPSGITPLRITTTEYYNATPDSSDITTDAPYGYWNFNNVKNAVYSTEIRNGGNVPVSRSEVVYDNYSTTANPTSTRSWDSTKNLYSNPLTPSNWITTSATYNQYGMPLTSTDANGNVTKITYGDVSGPNGIVTDLYPTQTISAFGSNVPRTSAATYDFYTGLPKTATDVDNGVTNATEYDVFGRPTKAIAAQGTGLETWTTTMYHDADSVDSRQYVVVRSDLETRGDGKKVATQFYDPLGRVRLSKTLEDAATQSATNETDGIKVQTRYRIGSSISYQLTSNPYRAATSTAETDPSMGWTLATGWSDGKRSEVQTFSGAGLPAAFGGSNTNSTGIVRTDIDADRTLVTDQAGKQRISKTNALGQLKDIWEVMSAPDSSTTSVSFPNQSGIAYGYQTSYSYDPLNNLVTVNQGSQTRSFAYSSLSRLTNATNPESGTIQYVYDANGNLTNKIDARSIVTSYTYDALNRVTARGYTNEPSGSDTPDVAYYYSLTAPSVGKLTKVSSSVSTTEYTGFDILGRVTAAKQTTDGGDSAGYTTGYTYKLSGALDTETYPSGRVVKNVSDANGDLSIVESKKNSAAGYWHFADSFTYNAAGAVTSMQLGNGRWESTVFNSRLQPTQIALGTTNAATDLLKLNYSYNTTGNADNNGNVLTQTITVPTVGSNTGFAAVQTYSYDELNRIHDAVENVIPTGGSSSQAWLQTFTYDRFGNRNFDEANTTTLPKNCGTSPNFTVCTADKKIFDPAVNTGNNRLSTSDGYGFDNSGNTTSDAQGRTFVYDADNKQTSVSDANGVTGQYWYDGDGKRVKKYVPSTGEITIFVYDVAGKEIAEYSTIVADTAHAQVNYLTADHLGSPRINTDANGAVTARHDYHPFGEEIDGVGGRTTGLKYGDDTFRKQFTGYERDKESGLDFAQARYYSHDLGRFSSADPIFFSKEHRFNPQKWNAYIYVLNAPTVAIDPSGKTPERIIDVFLTEEHADGSDWKAVQKYAKKHHTTINIFTTKAGTATVDQFLNSVQSKNRTVIVIGHSYLLPKDHEAADAGTGTAAGKGVGIQFAGPEGKNGIASVNSKGALTGYPTLEGVEAQAKNLVVLSCDFGDTFAPLGSSNNTNFLWTATGNNGLNTDFPTVYKVGKKMAEIFARGGSASEAQGAGSAILGLAKSNDGDTMIREVLQPLREPEEQ